MNACAVALPILLAAAAAAPPAAWETERRSSMPVLASGRMNCVAGWASDLGLLLAEAERPFAEKLLRYDLANCLRAPAEQRDQYCGKRG